MPRYFIEISYCGKNFNGWQVQPDAVTVQGEIERAISLLLREKVNIVGAGRTDTGVHARYYVAHFDTNSPKDVTSDDFKYHFNAILDANIVIHNIEKVKDDAHARFDAVSREYKYYVSPVKNPFARDFSYQYYRKLDVQKMNEAAAMILDYEDFTSFAKIHTDVKTNNCDVMVSEWAVEGDMLVYTVRANRFLRNMVRALVGTMLECGQGKITTEQFREIIEAKHRSRAGSSARSEGLFLTDVQYPYFERQFN
ncbi:MAG: tRNA pseudouridine(38-40) synthase TruA [Rikenellaceae bacterium]